MRCEYTDGMEVDYSGALRITKGDDINVYMKEGLIPANIKGNLDVAVLNYNCGELRKAAQEVTNIVGKRACIHE